MPIQQSLSAGSKDPYVLEAQNMLLKLGYSLPRFGADGVLGNETFTAYGSFLIANGLRKANDKIPSSITPEGAAALEDAFRAFEQTTPLKDFVDERMNHPHNGRSVAKPYRQWKDVTAIVLHQTASLLGEKPSRWHSVPIHFGVTQSGKIIQLYDLTEICNHANGLNQRSVGIEIDGWFSGIEGRPETLWQPSNSAPPRVPMAFPGAQEGAVRDVVESIIQQVSENGGKITHIHAHRQSSKDRQSDPGSLIWVQIGKWAQDKFFLSDGGASFKVGNGRTIPGAWDSRYPQNPY